MVHSPHTLFILAVFLEALDPSLNPCKYVKAPVLLHIQDEVYIKYEIKKSIQNLQRRR